MSLLINQNAEEQSDNMPEIEPTETITLTGLYGSGKSTWASELIENSDEDYVFVGSETADIGMDGCSIPLEGSEIVELQNVCMACNTDGEFDDAIQDVLVTIDEADRIIVEGPGNAGTRDMAGTVSDLPELDQGFVGRMINLENWEGEKSELSDADLKTANFIAVNRPTEEYGVETVESYLEEKDIDTQVFETTLDEPLDLGTLESEVEEWNTERLAKSMGPSHLMIDPISKESQSHSHKDTEYGRIKPEKDLQTINEALLEIDEEDLEGLRIKANIGDHFVNIVNGEMEIGEYEKAAPGYFIASNFGEIPENVKEAFSNIESLTGTAISAGASKESVKQNLEYKLENAQNLEIDEDISSIPDIHGSALKTSSEASEIWNDEEICQIEEEIAGEYTETAMELMYRNRDEPQALAELATELHWTAEKSSMDTETGREIAYEWLAEALSEMTDEEFSEIAGYSDGEEFFEYFSVMMDEAVEEGAVSESDYRQIMGNMSENNELLDNSTEYSGGVEV